MDEFTLPPGWEKAEGPLGNKRRAEAWVKNIGPLTVGCRKPTLVRVYAARKGNRYVAESYHFWEGWTKLGAFDHPLVAMLALEVELAG